jgi:hypothetical protein
VPADIEEGVKPENDFSCSQSHGGQAHVLASRKLKTGGHNRLTRSGAVSEAPLNIDDLPFVGEVVILAGRA